MVSIGTEIATFGVKTHTSLHAHTHLKLKKNRQKKEPPGL